MAWHARLRLDYAREGGRSVARFAHDGPLRILQSMWPEGDAVCHNVLVHPPGGLVGGDTLQVEVSVAEGSHGLVTTPGASRFYRSEGEAAVQDVRIRMEAGARLEWLPLEALYYSGCRAENRLHMDPGAGAEPARAGTSRRWACRKPTSPSCAAACCSTWSCRAPGWSAAASRRRTRA